MTSREGVFGWQWSFDAHSISRALGDLSRDIARELEAIERQER